MKQRIGIAAVLVAGTMAFWSPDAAAWGSANRYGGSTTHSPGETSHENRWGGGTTHEAGQGTEHTNAYGGSTAHAYGGGTEHTNMYGGRTYGEYGAGVAHTYPSGATAYRPPGAAAYGAYPAYHPPVAVPYYAQGCYGCAAAAGAVAGVTAGAVAGAAARSSAYAMGVSYAVLPPGAERVERAGAIYYVSGGTWFRAAFGANGVHYLVVPAP